jgi:hypothetical protein
MNAQRTRPNLCVGKTDLDLHERSVCLSYLRSGFMLFLDSGFDVVVSTLDSGNVTALA